MTDYVGLLSMSLISVGSKGFTTSHVVVASLRRSLVTYWWVKISLSTKVFQRPTMQVKTSKSSHSSNRQSRKQLMRCLSKAVVSTFLNSLRPNLNNLWNLAKGPIMKVSGD